ncbi:LOW QUALITY PROTEIN: hypothetical protein V2J09_007575 [Rumex salicifolius]
MRRMGVKMMTLLYRPFKTINAYLCEAERSFKEPTFVNAMRRIISGLNPAFAGSVGFDLAGGRFGNGRCLALIGSRVIVELGNYYTSNQGAPAQQRPNYRWKAVLTESDFRIYDCRFRGRVVHSALVTKDTSLEANINDLKDLCNKLQLVCPMENICHEEDVVKMMTLLYRPFKTINAYLCEVERSFEEPTFVNAMRMIISGLNNLHSKRFDPRLSIVSLSGVRLIEDEMKATTKNVMVIQDDGEENVIHTNRKYQTDFVYVGRAINTMIRELLGKSTLLRPSLSLKSLLKYMILVITKPQRHRLLLHPYFISFKNFSVCAKKTDMRSSLSSWTAV